MLPQKSEKSNILKIAAGSDHAGYLMKTQLVEFLKELGHEVIDCGTDSTESVDYPIYGQKVGHQVAEGFAEMGLCVCGTGIGISIAANKVKGVRAAVVHDCSSAILAREHNNANVICFGARLIGDQTAKDSLKEFLDAEFLGGRHLRRIEEISEMERYE